MRLEDIKPGVTYFYCVHRGAPNGHMLRGYLKHDTTNTHRMFSGTLSKTSAHKDCAFIYDNEEPVGSSPWLVYLSDIFETREAVEARLLEIEALELMNDFEVDA